MSTSHEEINAGRTEGKQACADYIAAQGWNAARDFLNRQVPPGEPVTLSLSSYGFWDGWCNHLVQMI